MAENSPVTVINEFKLGTVLIDYGTLQEPVVTGSVLGLVALVSVYHNTGREQAGLETSVLNW